MRILEFNDSHIPQTDKREFVAEDTKIYIPQITETNLSQILDALLSDKRKSLSDLYRDINSLEEVNTLWSKFKTNIVSDISKVTGFSEKEIEDFGLPVFEWFSNLSSLSDLQRLGLSTEAGDFPLQVTDTGYLYATGDPDIERRDPAKLIIQILSGNVIGYTALSLMLGVGGFPQLVKVSSQDPLTVPLYGEDLAKINPTFRQNLCIGYWSGGDSSIEDALFHKTGALVYILGSDETISSVKSKAGPDTHIIGHGHKVGVGIIEKEYVSGEIAEKIAKDIASWRGYACFNTKNIFVEGDTDNARKFSQQLAEQLNHFAEIYGYADDARSLKERFFLEYLKNPDNVLIGADYVIQIGNSFVVPPTLGKTVNIIPFSAYDEIPAKLDGYAEQLQTVVVAANEKRILELFPELASWGFTNVRTPGNANYIEPWEPHDGVFDFLIAQGTYDKRRWASLNLGGPETL